MNEITIEDKDRILSWFYEADIKGNEVPIEGDNLDICAILENDGYIVRGNYRHVLTLKGQSFFLNGGYAKEKEEKDRPIKIAEEANKKAKNANLISLIAIVLSIIGFIYTNHTKNVSIQAPKESNSAITDSLSNPSSIIKDTIKTASIKKAEPVKFKSQEKKSNRI